MSATRFCEVCGDPLPAGRLYCHPACVERARADAAAVGDPGNRVLVWVLTGLAVLAGAVMVGWKLWDLLRAMD